MVLYRTVWILEDPMEAAKAAPQKYSRRVRPRGRLNIEEKLAEEYLRTLGIGSVVHEPDGKQPPDFLVDRRIAVEVRRLNQNHVVGDGYEGLETARFRLTRQMRTLLLSEGPSEKGISWFVCHNFERPIPEWKELRLALSNYLRRFRGVHTSLTADVIHATISYGFEIELRRAGNRHSTFFVPGGSIDENSGGWALQETQKNLRICIEEKSRKTAPLRNRYPEWWLIFIDRVGFGVDPCDHELFRRHLQFDHDWNKIIILNPQNPCHAPFELETSPRTVI